MGKRRIDSLMVERGMAASRARAQALLMAGEVSVDGRTVSKPGTPVDEAALIAVREPPPFVSRGGLKLDYALARFRIDIAGKTAADIGASTGGFTDVLLQRGASRVYAIDVGTGQLDYRLRRDPRVVVMEGVNARYPVDLPEKVDIITIDVSFISVTMIIGAVRGLLKDAGDLVLLFKPQFEARREEVGKGGIIKDPALHAALLARFINWLVDQKLRLKGLAASPVTGASGNREFLMWLKMT